jgi:SAM-dependent methyltransferase
MDAEYAASYNRLDDHWWRRGRREVAEGLVRQAVAPGSRVLDIGCGSGGLLAALSDDYDITGLDVDPDGVAMARDRGVRAFRADATATGLRDAAFDCAVASDVLEHIPDEAAALREWRRLLTPGGVLVVFVPAFQWLWSSHDDLNDHQRRYSRGRLVGALEGAGLAVERSSYWNLATSPVAVPAKLVDRLVRSGEPQVRETAGPLNTVLYSALGAENGLVRRGSRIPFGTSVFAIARR